MDGLIKYDFISRMWQDASVGGWHFLSLPEDISSEIRKNLQWQEEGWGRMKATASIKNCQWKTAIWFDTKKGTYILPVKKEIRTKAQLITGNDLEVSVWV